MARLQICGWEAGDTSEAQTTSGTQSVQTSVVDSGTYALKVNPTTTGTGFHVFQKNGADGRPAAFAVNTLFVKIRFRVDTLPAANSEEILNFQHSGGAKGTVRINAAGNLLIYKGATTLVATGTTALSTATWYTIEVKMGTGGTAAYEIKINGVSEFSGTDDFNAAQHANFRVGKVVDRNGNSVVYYFDDLVIDDAAYPGDSKILVSLPNANGSTMQWTAGTGASNYTTVDEVPQSAADYVQSTGSAGDVALFAMQDTATVGISGTINSVKAQLAARENVGATSSTIVRIRSSSTNSDTTGFDGTTSVANQFQLLATDPSTSSAWTTSGIDAVEVGAVEANAVATRAVAVYLFVEFVAASGSAIKTINELAKASVKEVQGLAIASVKTWQGLA